MFDWKKVSTISLTIAMLFPQLALAADVSSSAFNPNYIVSDEDIQDWQSMSQDDIQAFLEQQKSALAGLTFTDATGTTQLASAIIAQAAVQYKISPKYLLVKLQKEQSLITTSAPTQKQLDWATGYGICDSCSMDSPSVQKFRGFPAQIDDAAGIMRWYYDNVNVSPIIKRPNVLYSIDNQSIVPANFATAFLYTYTPHLHGNQNFWRLWQLWFQQLYPDGTLVKTSDDSTVYLIIDGQKRPFGNEVALKTRFNESTIITVTSTQLNRYELGPAITIPNYSIMNIDGQFYLLNYDTVRPFASADVVAKLGYNPDEIITASTTDIAGLTIGTPITADSTGSPLGSIVRVKENKQLYYVIDGVYHVISDPAIAKNRFPNLRIADVAISSLATSTRGEPLLFKDGTLIGSKLTNKIYVIEHGYKRHIPNEIVFAGLGYDINDVLWIDEFTEENHPTGQPMSLPADVSGSSSDDADAGTGAVAANPAMVFVPESKTVYVGNKFDTPVNTYLVADAATGKVLAGKNIDTVRPLASLTKVVSAYKLLTSGLSLTKYTTYRAKRDKALYNYFRIADGERVNNADLLDAMLVSSLNTPVNMLIANIDTDKKHFVKGLNTIAKGWGLKHTNFADPAGEDPNTVSTAREYLSMWRKTTAGKTIPTELGKASYRYTEVLDKDKQPTHFDSNTNKLMEKTDLPFDILMSKTAYLDEAGAGLTMQIRRKTDGKKFVIIVMGNPDYPHRFVEPEKIARWAIENY